MPKSKSIVFYVVVLITLLSVLTACSSSTKADSNPLVGKYYMGRYHIEGQKYSSVGCVLRFYEDNTLQIVDYGMGRETDERTSYYATYTIEGNALLIKFASKESSGVILKDGSEIRVGTDTFTETDSNRLSKATLKVFK